MAFLGDGQWRIDLVPWVDNGLFQIICVHPLYRGVIFQIWKKPDFREQIAQKTRISESNLPKKPGFPLRFDRKKVRNYESLYR